ncbi:NUDIX hydrolase [Streptomyces sp. SP18CS02]|uniref:NUDIX hydrolase n=1 Tax=Streptomyces sp. SP18CS02 TaxID=3002531 RepID=UPI002E759D36|nr:NUDIX hydrolase [Streptomyces sp. SP18CS02]MEE1753641.1 NUDIX hydrolase [Streptomyces sp. SP18CS02]
MNRRLRVAAYAVCVRDGRILLARGTAADGSKEWTLPGGGMDHGEDPFDTVVREVEEETGYTAVVTALLGLDTKRLRLPGRFGATTDFQSLRILYEGRITGGELRPEADGTTDLAAWHPLDEVPSLARIGLVDTALRLWRERPPEGRAPRNG